VVVAWSLATAVIGVGVEPAAAVPGPNASDRMRAVVDSPAPRFWDQQEHERVGAVAYRYEVDDPSRADTLSAWYYVAFTPNGDRIRVYEHNSPPVAGLGPETGLSENTAWHVALTLLGRATGIARPGEIPRWAIARTGNINGPSAGVIYTLAELDLLTSGALGGQLRLAGTGAINSDGAVEPVRMVDAKLAAARAADADVFFARDPLPGAQITADTSDGGPRADQPIGVWLETARYEVAGREAASQPRRLAIVQVIDVRQALAWLCGRTGQAGTCEIAHAASAVLFADARPYGLAASTPSPAAVR
jgi:hypothetical protein